jgi:hypothetical protein
MLLAKLNVYGVRGIVNSWFKSYLEHWKQVVEINYSGSNYANQGKHVSAPREMKHGVPQGSILGPILFLLYVNDLPINIQESKIILFADDTNILATAENGQILQQKINRVMNDLHSWFYTNGLVINTDKTIAMSFYTGKKRDPVKPQVKFDNRDIAYKSEIKFLGIHISENMKWEVHVKSLSSKLSKLCYMIKSLKDVTNPHIIKRTYFAYILACLRHDLIFWGGDTKSEIVFKLQKRIIRMISCVGTYVSCRQLF